MSKGLEALEKIKDSFWNIYANKGFPHKECPDLEIYLNGIYHFDSIENELKALEIIKEIIKKEIRLEFLDLSWLPQEKHDLLKEMLK